MTESRRIVGGQEEAGSEACYRFRPRPTETNIDGPLRSAGISVQVIAHMDARQAVKRPATLLLDLFGAQTPEGAWGVVAQEGRRVGAPP